MQFCLDLNKSLSELLTHYEQVCVVSDAQVDTSRLSVLTPYPSLSLEISESAKSMATVECIWDFLFAQQLTRRGVVVCIGGGALTDMAGFAAATYKRGVDFIHIPTTLLAMVDASTGGKTGINYGGLKNSIGVFAQPVETLIDTQWLETLPAQEFLSGFGEMLKTGLIDDDKQLWNQVLQYDFDSMKSSELGLLIEQCVAVKERIVHEDPREEGKRKVLNFGHTFGHAIEEVSIQHSAVSHGYAVVYGMIAELYLSVVKLGCPKEPLQQLTQLMLQYYGKPQCKCSDREALIALMQRDKKNERAAEINCTLLRDIGSPVINQVITPEEAKETLEYLFSL
jgi:3-dehydroquinate synthase